jgi:hypothetical protein
MKNMTPKTRPQNPQEFMERLKKRYVDGLSFAQCIDIYKEIQSFLADQEAKALSAVRIQNSALYHIIDQTRPPEKHCNDRVLFGDMTLKQYTQEQRDIQTQFKLQLKALLQF